MLPLVIMVNILDYYQVMVVLFLGMVYLFFLGKTYNRPTRDKPYMSFYRQNELGTALEIEYDIYFPIKSEQLFP